MIAFSRRSRVRFDVEAKGNALSSLSATIAIMLLFNALNILLPFEPGVFLGLFLASARAARAARAAHASSSFSATIAILLLFKVLNIVLLPFEPGVFLALFLASAILMASARAAREIPVPLGDRLPFFAFFLADPTTG